MSKPKGDGQERSSKLAVVIMAAGKGARLKSRRPKALHEVGGKPLLSHVIAAVRRVVAPAHIFVVVGYEGEKVRQAVAASGVQFVDQPEQRGTGHAIQSVRVAIKGFENLLVLPGDVPLIRSETIEQLWQFHQKEGAAMTILSAAPQNPTGYRRVMRKAPGSAEVDAVVEQSMLKPAQESAGEIDSGIYAFKTAPLLAHLDKLTTNTTHGELYLAQIAGLLRTAGERVATVQVAEAAEVLGANTIAELAALDAALRAATANRLMAAGVTIFRPDTCVIDAEVEVEPDTVIEPFVQLLGNTRVGAECRIRSFTVIENCTLGNRIIIRQSCVLADSSIADGADIGPFARMRPGCEIGEDVHIGNFVEVKKSKLARGVKAGHLAYLGDSDIGARTNIGAGVITCNYDGAHKHITRIGEGVFVGSDSTLVAPVTIEDGAYIGAGSCITKGVPADALAIARAQQTNNEGWAAARRARQKAKS